MMRQDADFLQTEEVNQISRDAQTDEDEVEDVAALSPRVYQVD